MSKEFNSTLPPTPEELHQAGELSIFNEEGKEIKLNSLYKDQTTILIFIRHFSCGLCMDYISYLNTKIPQDKLTYANVKLVVIGCGEFSHIKSYRELLETPFEVYADPKKLTYTALGMTRRTLDGGSEAPEYQVRGIIGNIAYSILNIFKRGSYFGSGDIKALGGEFVIKRNAEDGTNIVSYTHRMENTRGHGKVEDLLAAAGIKN